MSKKTMTTDDSALMRSDVCDIIGTDRRFRIVAIASSTGGPKALQEVIPKLPPQLDAPVLVIQHMPKGFTASLAERLNGLGEIPVKEAEEGDVLHNGVVYLSKGGSHLKVRQLPDGQCVIHYSDEAPREGVKPCANYMYESLADCSYEQIVCVIMTGMGADGTEGIRNLMNKKSVHVISQSRESCTVYGMPKSIVNAGVVDEVVALEEIAQRIISQVGLGAGQ